MTPDSTPAAPVATAPAWPRPSAARRALAATGLLLGTLLGAGLPAGPAQAAAAAEARVLDLALTLVDLDPADAWTARASWNDGSSLLSGQIDLPGSNTLGPTFEAAWPDAFRPLSRNVSLPEGWAGASISAQRLAAWAQAGDGLAFSASATTGYGLLTGGLVLGPGSGLRLSLSYRLQASVDGRDSGCTECDQAQAHLTVLLGLGHAELQVEQRSVLADTGLALFSDSSEGPLSLAWNNTGPEDQTLGLGFTLAVSGQGFSAAPVPEPASALLLACGLAGLAGLGAAARRRHPC